MIRLCTHCKKVDTEDLENKYCSRCYTKLQQWLDNGAHKEPANLARKDRTGREIVKEGVRDLHYGRKK